MAAPDNPAIPLVQSAHRISRLRHLQFRPALPSADLHSLLLPATMASNAEEARSKVALAPPPASHEQYLAKGITHPRTTHFRLIRRCRAGQNCELSRHSRS